MNILHKFLFSSFLALSLTTPLMAQEVTEVPTNADMAVIFLTSEDTFKDLQIAPTEIAQYLIEVKNAFENKIKNSPQLLPTSELSVEVEITAVPHTNAKLCTSDYTKCFLMKIGINYNDIPDEKTVLAFKEELMKIREIKALNFKSKKAAKFIIKFNLESKETDEDTGMKA